MREVAPGTIVTVDAGGLRERTYWRLETHPHLDDRDATVARVRELLDEIVRRQLVADVPRCVLLSGGLDSSTITSLAASQLAEQGERVRSFAVDFLGQAERFKADALRPTADTPYVHAVAQYARTDHTDIVLDAAALADPEARRAALTARDLPMGLGDMDTSLYLLCKAIRERSTVALSGESADEIFGGYRQFHDPVAQRAQTFPWLVRGMPPFGGDSMLNEDLRAALDLGGHMRALYERAIAEVQHPASERDLEYRMRISSYLHLTRFLPLLLDRKDRMSMAVGLEVRVPFCDHRLVEYVYNAPWSLKSYDGREKSLLRGAARDVLPEAVVKRVKSPYPSTQDPEYVGAIQRQADDLLRDRGHAVFSLVDPGRVQDATRQDPALIADAARLGLERTLDLAMWLDDYRPQITAAA
jgi:asparagine synthase (glutamine-hydrolysing)